MILMWEDGMTWNHNPGVSVQVWVPSRDGYVVVQGGAAADAAVRHLFNESMVAADVSAPVARYSRVAEDDLGRDWRDRSIKLKALMP